MRKILCAVFVTAMLICVLAASAGAVNEPSADLVAGTAYRGETVSVDVVLNVQGVTAIGVFEIQWDDEVLEWTGGKWENHDGIALPNIQMSTGIASCAFSPAADLSGKILTLTFKVKEDAKLGSTTKIDAKVRVVVGETRKDYDVSETFEIVCNHTAVEVTDEKYLKQEASCTAVAEYWKSCSVCGEKLEETFKYGEVLPHQFTESVQKDEYKKSDATCTAKLTYFKSCKCGAKGEETFEVGDVLPHQYTESVQKDEYKKNDASCTKKLTYYKSCKCGKVGTETFEVGELLPHTYSFKVKHEIYVKNEASCTEKLTYYYSCICGRKGTETFEVGEALGHDWAAELTVGETAHWYDCGRCDEKKGETAHAYTEMKVAAEYEKTPATCTENAVYYKSCKCGVKGEETFVSGDPLTHVYTEEIANETFLKSVATCTEKAVYYKSCKCGEKGEETFEYGEALGHTYGTELKKDENGHWYECTACGEKKDNAAHIYDNGCDTDCGVCGYTRTTTHNYGTELKSGADAHWYECTVCGEKKDSAVHTFDNGCDTSCNACGYTREINHSFKSEWTTDAEGHWYECTVCGEKKDSAAHAFDNDCDTNCNSCGHTRATTHVYDNDCDDSCNVCGETREVTHKYKTEWSKNENEHWHECECGVKSDLAAHKWNDGAVTTEPTTEREGVKTYTCSDCGATRTESVAKLEEKGGCSSSKSGGLALISLFICAQVGVFFKKRRY